MMAGAPSKTARAAVAIFEGCTKSGWATIQAYPATDFGMVQENVTVQGDRNCRCRAPRSTKVKADLAPV